jgi:hypothetical protein
VKTIVALKMYFKQEKKTIITQKNTGKNVILKTLMHLPLQLNDKKQNYS